MFTPELLIIKWQNMHERRRVSGKFSPNETTMVDFSSFELMQKLSFNYRFHVTSDTLPLCRNFANLFSSKWNHAGWFQQYWIPAKAELPLTSGILHLARNCANLSSSKRNHAGWFQHIEFPQKLSSLWHLAFCICPEIVLTYPVSEQSESTVTQFTILYAHCSTHKNKNQLASSIKLGMVWVIRDLYSLKSD